MVAKRIDIEWLIAQIEGGNFLALARGLTLVENDIGPAGDLLKRLTIKRDVPVIGITGPPGAGKSTLVNAIAENFLIKNKKVAILAVDPTSPFNYGSLLGDRIRMSKHFNNPNIYIRSVATRGPLGGISAKTIEMVDVLRSSNFDLIMVETVGVGQSEVEIAGLADQTILVLVPEAGDEIQQIKSGLMEIAQAFVVNKADREGVDRFANSLQKMIREQHEALPVFKTIADKNVGLEALCSWILERGNNPLIKREFLLAEQAYRLIQHSRMRDVDKTEILLRIKDVFHEEDFNLYRFIAEFV